MGRSLPLVVVTLVIFSLLLQAPLVWPRGKIGLSYIIRSPKVKKFTNFLKNHAGELKDIAENVLSASRGQKNGDKLDTGAADTAGLYIFNLPVGTSVLQNITGILDITSELVWTQCAPCTACLPPPATTFQPTTSATFSGLPCNNQTCQGVISQACADPADKCTYFMRFSDYSNTSGYLASDTFTFGKTQVPGVLFGCSQASSGDFSGASGVLGFCRGSLSLVSQLQLSWFSYRLASDGSTGSTVSSPGDTLLQFGNDDAVPRTENSRSSPFLNNSVYPDLYFVKLIGIMVDGQHLNGIPAGTFDLQADGSGGVFLSTIVPVTYLEEAAYSVVKQAFISQINLATADGSALGLDLCYTKQSIGGRTLPNLTLVFDGTRAAPAIMELKKQNYFFADDATGLECLTILPSRGVSLLGSLLQTDRNITYDIHGGHLIFDTAFAPSAHLKVSLIVVVRLIAWALLF